MADQDENAMVQPLRTAALSDQELYLFDTMGVLKIAGFLGGKHIERCRDAIFSCPSRIMGGRGDKRRFDNLTGHSEDLNALAESTSIRGCVEPLINQPHRLIESYGLYRESDSVFYLHNGNSEHLAYGNGRRVQRNMSYVHTFQNGKLYCMFVKVIVYMDDLRTQEDGPFCYIPGSHKANFSWFGGTIEESAKPALTLENFPSLAAIYFEAGDALIINEALLHGTLPKTSAGGRLVMALSYAPCFVADWASADIANDDIHRIGHY